MGRSYGHPLVAAADPRDDPSRRLRDLVRQTRLIGALFTLLGALMGLPALFYSGPGGAPILGFIALSVFASGVAYIAFGSFLKQRRYWAWLAIMIITSLMLVMTLAAGLLIVIRLLGEVFRSGDAQLLLAGACPSAMFGCWAAGLVVMLVSLRRALPSIREAEAEGHVGFAVILVARVAQPDVPDSAADAAGKPAG